MPAVITCTTTEFKCSNGQCIPKALMCDGKMNCIDGGDEEINLCTV